MYEGGRKIWTVIALCSLLGGNFFPLAAHSATDTGSDQSAAKELKDEADGLNASLDRKKQRVKEIQGLINTYADRITKQEEDKITLENQITLLDNRIREKELRIEEVKTQLEVLDTELQLLDKNIKRQETRIGTQKDLLNDLLRRLRQTDDVNTLHVFLSRPTLSSYFNRVEEYKKLDGDLGQTLHQVVEQKTSLENDKIARENTRTEMEKQKKNLTVEQAKLAMELNSKKSLLAETSDKQDEFNRMLDELRQQNESTSDEISQLEKRLKDKLNDIDQALARGETLLLWPVPVRKITAYFHDPSYPFRNLFQHPGVDLRSNVGTPIKAAAGGYVAFTRTGRQYGNYIMIVHPGGYATVYGHLSKFVAKPDTYVERGDVIGMTGGMPGMQGAGLSTGPHLHFEVRQEGIPVDPLGFLPEAIETDK